MAIALRIVRSRLQGTSTRPSKTHLPRPIGWGFLLPRVSCGLFTHLDYVTLAARGCHRTAARLLLRDCAVVLLASLGVFVCDRSGQLRTVLNGGCAPVAFGGHIRSWFVVTSQPGLRCPGFLFVTLAPRIRF
jgi:hypothetical protein